MASNDSTATGGFLSSPRAQRRMLWLGGTVLGIGLIVFLTTVVFRGSSGLKSPISTVAAKSAPRQIKTKPDPAAFKVGRKFIETAVLRKNLDVAYPLVSQEIKGGMSEKQWDHGNIPVIPYPAGNVRTAGFQVLWSYKTQLMLTVDLVARKGTSVRPHLPFYLGLRRAHNKPNGHWLVNYWQADWTPPVLSNK